jgi:preprotein translocase subunit SecG
VYTLLIVLFIVVCLFLIMVVLLQQGKGADVAAAFGGSSSQASFGPRGTATLMHKLTTGSFVLFVALCIGLSVMTARRGRSVTAGLKGKAAATAPVPAKPAGQAPAPAGQAPAQAPAQGAPETPTPPKK